jgi:hypothetical protein
MSEKTEEAIVRETLLNLPGCRRVKTPIPSNEDRKNYIDVVRGFKPLIAELAMERMISGLVEGTPEGTEFLKIMAPYLFKKEAQVIETKSLSGDMEDFAVAELTEHIRAGRPAEVLDVEPDGEDGL